MFIELLANKQFVKGLETTCKVGRTCKQLAEIFLYLQRVFGHLQMILLYKQTIYEKFQGNLQTNQLAKGLHLVTC